MTDKERKKLFFKTVKVVFKTSEWKFNNSFVFKSVNDFFFDCDLYFHPKENKVNVNLGYKPMILDDIFWDITEMPENKNMPLSFRSNAAFHIHSFPILEFDLILNDIENPSKEIFKILQTVNEKVNATINTVKNTIDYLDCISGSDYPKYNSIITSHIYHKEYDIAKQKIAFCREKKINSGYVFGKYDFYDMAEKYIARIEKKPKVKFNWKSIFYKS